MKGFVSNRLHPLVNLILLLVSLLAAFCVAGFFISMLGNLFFGVGLQEIGNVTQHPTQHPQGWALSMLSQGVLLFVGFAGGALALVKFTGYRAADYFAPRRPVPGLWQCSA